MRLLLATGGFVCLKWWCFRFYTKRCFLALTENMAKHMVVLSDAVYQECLLCLEQCEGLIAQTGILFFKYFFCSLWEKYQKCD